MVIILLYMIWYSSIIYHNTTCYTMLHYDILWYTIIYDYSCPFRFARNVRGSSVKLRTLQRRLAWPLRKDGTHESGSVNDAVFTVGCLLSPLCRLTALALPSFFSVSRFPFRRFGRRFGSKVMFSASGAAHNIIM